MPRTKTKEKKRVGRGSGSGKEKTAGRGTKGQKARSSIPLYFEGGALALIKRLPYRKGKGRNKVFRKKPIVINIKTLNLLPENSVIDIDFLVKHKIVYADQAKVYGVKILGEGEILKPIIVKLPVSKGARIKIEKAGGRIE